MQRQHMFHLKKRIQTKKKKNQKLRMKIKRQKKKPEKARTGGIQLTVL